MDLTPFGMLVSGKLQARSWQDFDAGQARSSLPVLGFGWVFPTTARPRAESSLFVTIQAGESSYRTRPEFDLAGLRAIHHGPSLITYACATIGWSLELSYFLSEDGEQIIEALDLRSTAPRSQELIVGLGAMHAQYSSKRKPARQYPLTSGATLLSPPARSWSQSERVQLEAAIAQAPPAMEYEHLETTGSSVQLRLAAGETVRTLRALGRMATDQSVDKEAALSRLDIVRRDHDRMTDRFPRLEGDWPSHWPNGFRYDFETARACVMSPSGVFDDYWLSWMASWPRAVLAENSLDALRLAYGDPALARRALGTTLRCATGANLPCVFAGGEPNMVARDSEICGTSPAWCLPFKNIEQLYWLDPDPSWLAEIYPQLAGYLDFWLDNRTDEDGWITYHCTWEAGEDGSLRLDPGGSGDNPIGHLVRPVELQSTVSHAAAVMALFAKELGMDGEWARWRQVAEWYRRRTLDLWHAGSGRFRDWDKPGNRFLPWSNREYWGVDHVEFSALSFTALLTGGCTEQQLSLLKEHFESFQSPPWLLWPSWSHALLESASAVGWLEQAGEMAWRTADRVYRVTDRRTLGAGPRPLPGVAPEFWPDDPRAMDGADCYGWGGSCALFVLRHVLGFRAAPSIGRRAFELSPAVPRELASRGSLGVRGLRFAGHDFDVHLRQAHATTRVVLEFDRPVTLSRSGVGESRRRRRHVFNLERDQRHFFRLLG